MKIVMDSQNKINEKKRVRGGAIKGENSFIE